MLDAPCFMPRLRGRESLLLERFDQLSIRQSSAVLIRAANSAGSCRKPR
jgi:hypothetical protein